MSPAPVLLDFESRSRADLKTVGGRRYWEHESSQVLVCCWYDLVDGSEGAWFEGDRWPHAGRVLAAHHADGFDRFAAERHSFRAAEWIDTSALARRAGLPGALDALGVRWLGVPKDSEGSEFTKRLSSVRKPRDVTADDWRKLSPAEKRARGVLPAVTPEALERVIGYCESDVAILAGAWPRLAAWLDVDADALRVDRIVNDRGVPFDRDLARALLRYDAARADRAVADAARALGWTEARVRTVAGSPEQCAAELGTGDARKATLADIDSPLVRARQALASIARGKLLAGLARCSEDGRLRDSHRYYGGHTGRWAGRGMQLQNLPRPADAFERWTDDDRCRAADDMTAGRAPLAGGGDLVNVLLRATIAAPPGRAFATCDFSGVEARALAWCAGDEDALAVFRSGRDPYRVMASIIFGESYDSIGKGEKRTLGKIAELALGYGQGARKFGDTARTIGRVDLDALGVDAAGVVEVWRRAHAPIVRFWRACEAGWRAALEGRARRVAGFDFCPGVEDEVAVFLPSGRPLVYPVPRVAPDGRELSYLGTGDDPKALVPMCPRHFARVHGVDRKRGTGTCEHCGEVAFEWRTHVYGGKLAENLIQALCRDLLSDALVRVEAAGLGPVMHVHDEIVCEVRAGEEADAYESLCAAMLDVPSWAKGFPAGAAGWTGRRYRK